MSSGFVQKLRDLFGLKVREDTPLEVFLARTGVKRSAFAYENKRDVKGQSYPVFIHEFITPRAYVVRNVLMKNVLLTDEPAQRVRNVGNILAKRVAWTDDKDLSTSADYYQLPAETLTLKKGDCEDHAFIMTSALPADLGVAYGYVGKTPHAFNVFVQDDELWVCDTVTDKAVLKKLAGSEYKVHYVITPAYTFVLDASVSFGTIAGWETTEEYY